MVATFYDQIAENKRRSAVALVVFVLVLGFLIYGFSQVLGSGTEVTLAAFVFSLISAFGGYLWGDKLILAVSGARPADKNRDFEYFTVAQNLSLGAGLPMPALYVIEDSAPNAFATGRDPKHAVICATTGLLEKLDRTELEGVVAHELSHVRNFDIRLMMITSVLVGMIALLADWFLRFTMFGGRRRRNRDEGNFSGIIIIVGLILSIIAPIFTKLMQLALSREREFLADASAASLTRQPRGLISALKKISEDAEPLEVANRATAPLYIVNPFKGDLAGKLSTLFSTHPPVLERIRRLEEI